MLTRISLAIGLAAILLNHSSGSAVANCLPGDQACERFNATRASKPKVRKKKRARVPRTRRKSSPQSLPEKALVTGSLARPAAVALVPQMLPAGSIRQAPKRVDKIAFVGAGRIEVASAHCEAVTKGSDGAHSDGGQMTCSIAVHSLAQITEAGSGCLSSVKLETLTFRRTPDRRWLHEQNLPLCGGTLRRSHEWVPVQVGKARGYGMRVTFKMLGGDASCAVPYLNSREGSRLYINNTSKTIAPMNCGSVTFN